MLTNWYKNYLFAKAFLANRLTGDVLDVTTGEQHHGRADTLRAVDILKGIALFDTEQTETADEVIRLGNGNLVGRAGSDYAGTDPYRGDYNETESGAITGGYRHVWDFHTDKSNGTIRSACLCPEGGGDGGWSNDMVGEIYSNAVFDEDDNCVDRDLFAPEQKSDIGYDYVASVFGDFAITPTQCSAYPLGYLDDLTVVVLVSKYVNSPTTYSYALYAVNMGESLDYGSRLNEMGDSGKAPLLSYSGATGYGFGVYNGHVYRLKFVSASAYMALEKIDSEGNVVSTVTLNTLFTPQYYGTQKVFTLGIKDGYAYVVENTFAIKKFNLATGAFVENITVPSSALKESIRGINNFNDEFLCISLYQYGADSSTRRPACLLYDGTKFSSVALVSQGCGGNIGNSWGSVALSNDSKYPVCVGVIEESSVGFYIMPRIIGHSFATVNNLDTPVIKNDSQTMKVTYDIIY